MSRPHILVVEDESRIATLISKYLTTEGYQFTWLADGSEALSWIKQLCG